MKKLSTRTILIMMIAVASIGSYIYLNTLDLTTNDVKTTVYEPTEENIEQAEDQNDTKLPDLRLLMKAVEIGQKLLPAS